MAAPIAGGKRPVLLEKKYFWVEGDATGYHLGPPVESHLCQQGSEYLGCRLSQQNTYFPKKGLKGFNIWSNT